MKSQCSEINFAVVYYCIWLSLNAWAFDVDRYRLAMLPQYSLDIRDDKKINTKLVLNKDANWGLTSIGFTKPLADSMGSIYFSKTINVTTEFLSWRIEFDFKFVTPPSSSQIMSPPSTSSFSNGMAFWWIPQSHMSDDTQFAVRNNFTGLLLFFEPNCQTCQTINNSTVLLVANDGLNDCSPPFFEDCQLASISQCILSTSLFIQPARRVVVERLQDGVKVDISNDATTSPPICSLFVSLKGVFDLLTEDEHSWVIGASAATGNGTRLFNLTAFSTFELVPASQNLVTSYQLVGIDQKLLKEVPEFRFSPNFADVNGGLSQWDILGKYAAYETGVRPQFAELMAGQVSGRQSGRLWNMNRLPMDSNIWRFRAEIFIGRDFRVNASTAGQGLVIWFVSNTSIYNESMNINANWNQYGLLNNDAKGDFFFKGFGLLIQTNGSSISMPLSEGTMTVGDAIKYAIRCPPLQQQIRSQSLTVIIDRIGDTIVASVFNAQQVLLCSISKEFIMLSESIITYRYYQVGFAAESNTKTIYDSMYVYSAQLYVTSVNDTTELTLPPSAVTKKPKTTKTPKSTTTTKSTFVIDNSMPSLDSDFFDEAIKGIAKVVVVPEAQPFLEKTAKDLAGECQDLSAANRSPPPAPGGKPIQVVLQFNADRMLGIKDIDQTISITASLNIYWWIETCRFSNNSFANSNDSIRMLANNVDDLWRPTIEMLSSNDDIVLTSRLLYSRTEVIIDNAADSAIIDLTAEDSMIIGGSNDTMMESGDDPPATLDDYLVPKNMTFYWKRRGIFRSRCQLDLSTFPFDTQRCGFLFRILEPAQLVHVADVKLQMPTQQALATLSEQWTFKRCYAAFAIKPSTYGDNVSEVTFYYVYQRRADYFMQNLLVPSFVLVGLAMISFLIPPSSSDRVCYSVYVFLAFAVSQQQVLAKIPKSSQQIFLNDIIHMMTAVSGFVTVFANIQHWLVHRYPKIAATKVCFPLGVTISFSRFLDVTVALLLLGVLAIIGWYFALTAGYIRK